MVTAESARALPGKTVLYPDEDNYILKGNIHGSNHMQMRNDEHLKTKLDRLYDGDYGWFFRIERK